MIEQYKTTDIVLAAYLKLNGHEMTGIEKRGTVGTFIFSNVEETLLRQFDLGNTTVEPIAFNDKVKQLTAAVRRS